MLEFAISSNGNHLETSTRLNFNYLILCSLLMLHVKFKNHGCNGGNGIRRYHLSGLKLIGYNINVMRQTACLVVNPIKVNSFAYLFNCTTVGRTSD